MRETFELQNPIVTMEIEGHGTIKIELFPEAAPETVRNFIALIEDGYYDGLNFHRIENGDLTLIQGGDWAGTGAGGNDYSVVGEFAANDHNNPIRFERGVVGLARQDFTSIAHELNEPDLIGPGYNTGFAQFFIMGVDEPAFDGRFTAFGRVIEGMDIVDALILTETEIHVDEETGEESPTSVPIYPPVMRRVTVETFGISYREPELVRTFDMDGFLQQIFQGMF
ncbi:MAG: peptidylprolyl isomerase [Oscillospiraceae bacterium]|nr:peptidylprolyl isomerase [Oscillospiraceae bacterium]